MFSRHYKKYFIIISLILVLLYYKNYNWKTHKSGHGFNIDKNKLVFLHIQKTSGREFDKKLTKHLMIHDNFLTSEWKWKNACLPNGLKNYSGKLEQTYKCTSAKNQNNWLFNRITSGWICGVHASYPLLQKCFNNSNDVFIFTMLRNPIDRYISEWNQLNTIGKWSLEVFPSCVYESYEKCFENRQLKNFVNSTFENEFRQCKRKLSTNGQAKNKYDVCFKDIALNGWKNSSLDEFMECEYNIAANRQTKWLANFDDQFSMCEMMNSNHEIQEEILERAKTTLESLPFFALTEYQFFSMKLFENMIGDKLFRFNISQMNKTEIQSDFNEASRIKLNMDDKTIDKIKKLNRLDMILYEYAIELFFKRLKYYKII